MCLLWNAHRGQKISKKQRRQGSFKEGKIEYSDVEVGRGAMEQEGSMAGGGRQDKGGYLCMKKS